MEPPLKRRRFSERSHPESDLHARRAQNDLRLKSIFESIFDKYGKDFDGIGDEIDMETGEIVVNNGHILGMTNERDVGDAEYSSEELANSDDENEHSSIGYREEHDAAPRSSKARDAAVIEESEASEQSDFDADSLMGDIPTEPHLHHLGKESRRAVSIPTDDEEDELASSDIERASQSKDGLGPQERWCLFKDKTSLEDEPAFEPAWRAPPLPKIPQVKKDREDFGLAIVDTTREYSDDERAGISLWTPEVKELPRRRRESANSLSQRSISFACGQQKNGDGPLSDFSYLEPAARRKVKWTYEEEQLLIRLKSTTNLSCQAMEPYFPERQGTAIGSHWNYMNTVGKASPKPQVATGFQRRTPLPSLYPSTTPLAPEGTREELPKHDTFLRTKKPRNVQQQLNERLSETRSFVRSSNRPLPQLGDHHVDPQQQVSGDHGTLSGYTVDQPIWISDDIGAHIGYRTGEHFLSSRDCETEEDFSVDESLDGACEPSTRTSGHYHPVGKVHNRSDRNSIHSHQEKALRTKGTDPRQTSVCRTFDTARRVDGGYKTAESVYLANSSEFCADTDPSRCRSQPLEMENDVVMRREKHACNLPDQGLEAVSENGCGAQIPSLTTSIKDEPDFEGADLYSDGIVSPNTQPRSTAAMGASNSLQRLRTNHSGSQEEESIPTAAEDIIQIERSTLKGPQKTGPTSGVSIASAQPPDHGKPSVSQEPDVEVSNKNITKRHIVQVVIPLAATSNLIRKNEGIKQSPLSHPHARSSLASTETEDPASIGQLSATAESTPAALDPRLPNQEILVIRTPTRSPSVAVAESQYATSAAFVLNDVRSSLGPEIADSQPLRAVPALATPAPELGGEAIRPIILDAESQSLRMTPGVAPSPRKQPKKTTETINLDSDSQALRLTPRIAAPAPSRIEEVIDDIVESGSHPLGETPSAARSALKKAKKENAADSFSSIWTAIGDYSEDELSYL